MKLFSLIKLYATRQFHDRYRDYWKALNRRVEIEQILLEMAAGKQPLPTREDCFVLAMKLGTPKEHWSDKWGQQ